MSINITNTMSILRRTLLPSVIKKLHRSLASNSFDDSTLDPKDVSRHSQLQLEWWSPDGPMKALHTFNQLRVPFIRDGIMEMGNRSMYPLNGKSILDVGCGGGILSEPLARLGAKVTGIDASQDLIQIATNHSSRDRSLDHKMPEYYCTTIENFAPNNEQAYDAVVASEIIEHVNNQELFVQMCIHCLKPNGHIFFTTPNRTNLAQLGVIYLSEYIFRTVPKGTHQFNKFTTPQELQFMLERNKCFVELTHGMVYNFFTNRWSWSDTQAFTFALRAVRTH